MNRIILGPSHVTRWRWELKNNSIPTRAGFEYWGRMGIPIFNLTLSRRIKHNTALGYEVFLLVPDFRFGNSVINDEINMLSSGKVALNDDHVKLDKSMISKENDLVLYNNSIDLLKRYSKKFKDVKFIFWCLFSRERQNLVNGKYIEGVTGEYKHPIWNLKDVEELFSDNVIPLHGIINRENIDSMFIDQQGHPTLKGYSLIHNAIIFNSFERSFSFVEGVYDSFINELFSN